MSRPPRCRKICFSPSVVYFKPAGIPLMELKEVSLEMDELEAMRLKDYEGLDQEESARMMKISQPTFHRIIKSARRKIAESIIDGKAIKIKLNNEIGGKNENSSSIR